MVCYIDDAGLAPGQKLKRSQQGEVPQDIQIGPTFLKVAHRNFPHVSLLESLETQWYQTSIPSSTKNMSFKRFCCGLAFALRVSEDDSVISVQR